mgnify:FL=1
MPDTVSNIIIDISGNTANMATDFASSGVGITAAHVPIQKIAFGDETVSTRVSSNNPLPITIQSNQELVGVSGSVGITGNATIVVPFEPEPTGITNNFIKVAGTSTGGNVGITGTIQGISGGFPVPVSGTVNVSNATGLGVFGVDGLTAVSITGGRRLNHADDSVRIENSVIGVSGGRTILAATDSIKVFGSDATPYVPVVLAKDRTGSTAGFSGDALKVAVTNTSFTATVNVSATTGVTNDSPGNALKVQGLSGGEPLMIKGENGGAVNVTATSSLPVSFSGTQTINDTNIVNALESSTKPLITNLSSINQDTSSISLIRNDLNSGNVSVKVSETEQPTAIRSGSKSVGLNATQIIGSGGAVKVGVKVKASLDNTDTVLIGNFRLVNGESAGYPLEPGESCFLNVNDIGLIYARSSSGKQTIHYLGS